MNVKDVIVPGHSVKDERRDASTFSLERPALAVLDHLDGQIRRGELGSLTALPTGFRPLDRFLDGGIRPSELILVGGIQGVGKTILTLQMARNLAAQTQAVCAYVCYEHEETFLLQRLIALETFLGRDAASDPVLTLSDLRGQLIAAGRAADGTGKRGIAEAWQSFPAAVAALDRIQSFGSRLFLFQASSVVDDASVLRRLVRDLKKRHDSQVVLFVDYLQKLPTFPRVDDEVERTTQITHDLKDIALTEKVPVVAVVAADQQGLQAPRLHLSHLRGSSSLAYESDVVLILNNKYRIVTKPAITFNPHQAQGLRHWMVCTIEKNRSGSDHVDLEFRTVFAAAAFDPQGKVVTDTLIDERIGES